jgi:Kef-type K+ transport system membrane component KefB
VASLVASFIVWLVFVVAPERLSADAQSAAFLLVVVPTLVALAIALFAPGVRLHRPVGARSQRRSSAPTSAPISTL